MAGASKKRQARRGPAAASCRRRRSQRVTLLGGDCLEVMAGMEAESVDVIVTDPPYGIGFNSEDWDERAIREVAARAGEDRLSTNEAFQVWARIWATECRRVMKPGAFLLAFGSPRTYHRLAAGIEDGGLEIRDTLMWLFGSGMSKSRRYEGGRATTLKPGFEPIVLARRELDGTTAQTIARHGTGALNADACRVGDRHPANVILQHDDGCGEAGCAAQCAAAEADRSAERNLPEGSVRPSRIFYCSKANRAERDAGCEELAPRELDLFPQAQGKKPASARNPHPTVKPLELMRWLIRLACPPDGVVLDPTCGSGTTGAAAVIEDRRFIGIELEPAYMEIAAARIAHWSPSGARKPKPRHSPLARRR